MIIVAGHLIVDPDARKVALDDRREVVVAARAADGCHDFYLSADPVEPDRINIFERWASVEAVEVFRAGGPSDEQQQDVQRAQVVQYEIADVTALT